MNPRIEYGRRSIRCPKYNYTSPGAYFVTICTFERERLFGEIKNGEMALNGIGKIVQDCWVQIPKHFTNTEIDESVIMPNHTHGIIWITDIAFGENASGRGTACRAPTGRRAPTECTSNIERFGKPVVGSIPTIVRSFKSAVTKRGNEMNALFGPVWQRNYHERIIRSERELDAVRQYIRNNPGKWEEDEYFSTKS